jgi:hypothetical protein
MKEIMGDNDYDNYKATMAVYLAPNNLHIHERFCCAYCERVFPDQWILEKVKFSLSACPRNARVKVSQNYVDKPLFSFKKKNLF